MFNLDEAIANWRRQMTASGIKSAEVLDELENHLREDIMQQRHSGRPSEQQAFGIATRRIGHADALRVEFARVGEAPEPPYRKNTRIGCLISAVVFALISGGHQLIRGLDSGQRVLGFAVVAAITAYLCSLPYLWRILPATKSRRTAAALQIAVAMIWLGCGVFILANLSNIEIAGPLWATMSVVAVLVWIPRMIEHDVLPPEPDGGLSLPPGGGAPLQPRPFCPIPGPRLLRSEVHSPFRAVGWPLASRPLAPL
jgi:hypothetical protein